MTAPEQAFQRSPLVQKAIDAAINAAKVARKAQLSGNLQIERKSHEEDWVTKGDHASQAKLFRTLPKEALLDKEIQPIGFIGEETPANDYHYPENTKYRWIVDPIDGTKPYKDKEHTWSVSIALQKHTSIGGWESQIGVIYQASPDDTADTLKGKIFWAEKGKGAFLLDLATGQQTPLKRPQHIEPVAEYCQSSVPDAPSTPFNDWAEKHLSEKGITTAFRRSCCYAACEMLEGKKCAVIQGTEGPYDWDIAALSIITKEAGAHMHVEPSSKTPKATRYGIAIAWEKELFDDVCKQMPRPFSTQFKIVP